MKPEYVASPAAVRNIKAHIQRYEFLNKPPTQLLAGGLAKFQSNSKQNFNKNFDKIKDVMNPRTLNEAVKKAEPARWRPNNAPNGREVKPRQCRRCYEYGHLSYNCKNDPVQDELVKVQPTEVKAFTTSGSCPSSHSVDSSVESQATKPASKEEATAILSQGMERIQDTNSEEWSNQLLGLKTLKRDIENMDDEQDETTQNLIIAYAHDSTQDQEN